MQLNDNNQLPKLFFDALEVRKKLDNFTVIVGSYIHLSEYYHKINDINFSIKYSNEALRVARESKIPINIILALKQASNVDDNQIVNSIKLVNYLKYTTTDDILTLLLTYNKEFDIPFNLKDENPKTYKGQVYLINGMAKINIGFVSVVSNGLNNGVLVSTNSGAEISISPNIKNDQTFNVILVFDDETISNNVKDLFTKSGIMLKLEWETGGSSQCNFNNNNGI
jgi:hypothetical protein